MNKYSIKYVVSLLLFVAVGICSCQSNISKPLSGDWVVEKIYYNESNVKQCLRLNLITFHENGQCNLPTSFDSCGEFISNTSQANWEIMETDSIALALDVKSSNIAFARTYRLILRADESIDKLIMEIISDDLYMLCHRRLLSSGVNRKTIESIIEISHRDQGKWPKNR